MELNTPEERIAAAIWSPTDSDFRDVCNAIRLYVDREREQAKLEAYSYLLTSEGQQEARKHMVTDLIFKQRKAVDELNTRIRLMEQKNVRPIRP